MRAGLLSEPTAIRLINENFVSTWVLIDDLKRHAGIGNDLADTLSEHWEYPLDLMYLSEDGEFLSKLNSFRDLPNAHPDVGGHGNPFARQGWTHEDVFLRRTREFLSRYRR